MGDRRGAGEGPGRVVMGAGRRATWEEIGRRGQAETRMPAFAHAGARAHACCAVDREGACRGDGRVPEGGGTRRRPRAGDGGRRPRPGSAPAGRRLVPEGGGRRRRGPFSQRGARGTGGDRGGRDLGGGSRPGRTARRRVRGGRRRGRRRRVHGGRGRGRGRTHDGPSHCDGSSTCAVEVAARVACARAACT